MAMSDRNRRKHVKAAQKLIPDAHVTGYAIGRSGAQPTIVVAAMLGTVVLVSGMLIVLTGSFVLPGVLPMLIIQHYISPPRAVVIADQGVALAARSVWTGRPSKILSLMSHGYVQPVETSLGRVKVGVGNDHVWLPAKEEAIVRAAVTQHVAPPAGSHLPPAPFTA